MARDVRTPRDGRWWALGAAALVAALVWPVAALALDRVTLNSGETLEGEVFDAEVDFIRLRLADGGVRFIPRSSIRSIETVEAASREGSPVEPTDEPAAAGAIAPAAASAWLAGPLSGAVRIAVLPFGPPLEWQGVVGDTVGVQITAAAWKDAVADLTADDVSVVVVRVNSGGGLLDEVHRFHEVYEREYRPRFRTVAWIDSAISAAAMSTWVLPEIYFLSQGSLGACTAFSGDLRALEGPALADVLHLMERASLRAGRSPHIMRAMQVPEPLSVNISAENIVTWFADETGKYLVNPTGQILTIGARDAAKFRLAAGVADTPAELARVMGLGEAEWVGERAARRLERAMRVADAAVKAWPVERARFDLAIGAARQLVAREDRRDGLILEVGVARRSLRDLARHAKVAPSLVAELPETWFDDRERELRELIRR